MQDEKPVPRIASSSAGLGENFESSYALHHVSAIASFCEAAQMIPFDL